MPTAFVRLCRLEKLLIAENQLKSLPETVFKDLTNLYTFDLSFIHLKEVPNQELAPLHALRKLDLFNNFFLTLKAYSLVSNRGRSQNFQNLNFFAYIYIFRSSPLRSSLPQRRSIFTESLVHETLFNTVVCGSNETHIIKHNLKNVKLELESCGARFLAPRTGIAPLSFAPTRTGPKNSKFYGPDPGPTRLYFPRTGPDRNSLASTRNLKVSTRTDPKF